MRSKWVTLNFYYHWIIDNKPNSKQIKISTEDKELQVFPKNYKGGFKQIRNQLYSVPTFSNKMYFFDRNQKITLKYFFDIREYTPTADRLVGLKSTRGLEVARLFSPFLSEDHLLATYSTTKKSYLCLFNRKTKVQAVGERKNNLLAAEVFRNVVYSNEDSFVAALTYDKVLEIKEWLNQEMCSNVSDNLQNLKERLELIQNGENALVKFKIKGI